MAGSGSARRRTPPAAPGASGLVLAAMLALGPSAGARADVYTWVDKAGTVNVSNVAPPKDARVVRVTHEDPAANARAIAAQAAAREAAHAAEVKALSDRVAELERVSQPRRDIPPPPPPVQYAAAPAPPVVLVVAPPAPQEPAPLPTWDCAWVGCALPFFSTFTAVAPFVPRHGHHRDVHHPPAPRPSLNPAGPTPKPVPWGGR